MAKQTGQQSEKQKQDLEEKEKAIEAAKLQIEKQFGKGSLMKLGARTENMGMAVIPSGSITLDAALGGIHAATLAEIDQLHVAVSGQEHVARLEIGVDEPGLVHGLKPFRRPGEQQQKVGQRLAEIGAPEGDAGQVDVGRVGAERIAAVVDLLVIESPEID